MTVAGVIGAGLTVDLGGETSPAGAADVPMRCAGLQVSQGFGNTPWEHPHTGIDIVCPPGTPVLATLAGVFHRRIGPNSPCGFPAGKSGGLGLVGEVDAGPLAVLDGHLEMFAVQDGAAVRPAQVVGFEGNSGCSSGPHLHFQTNLAGRPVNPCSYLPAGYPAAHGAGGTKCWGAAPP